MHLLADRGYSGQPALDAVTERGYHARIRQQGKARRGRPPKHRRWVVEAAHSWFNRFRKLLVRFEKLHESYLALVHLAAAIICWRKALPIMGTRYPISTIAGSSQTHGRSSRATRQYS